MLLLDFGQTTMSVGAKMASRHDTEKVLRR
jgi:hypothetical protein